MRPEEPQSEGTLYECPVCGGRGEASEGRLCADCGVARRNLGVARDL